MFLMISAECGPRRTLLCFVARLMSPNHILREVDDRPSSLEASFTMLTEAAEAGSGTIVATSHMNSVYA